MFTLVVVVAVAVVVVVVVVHDTYTYLRYAYPQLNQQVIQLMPLTSLSDANLPLFPFCCDIVG